MQEEISSAYYTGSLIYYAGISMVRERWVIIGRYWWTVLASELDRHSDAVECTAVVHRGVAGIAVRGNVTGRETGGGRAGVRGEGQGAHTVLICWLLSHSNRGNRLSLNLSEFGVITPKTVHNFTDKWNESWGNVPPFHFSIITANRTCSHLKSYFDG